jgi:uncharacterized glyoxalase superfamily protein PhnB
LLFENLRVGILKSRFEGADTVNKVAKYATSDYATRIAPLKDEQDGNRRGGSRDPFGFTWWIATNMVPMSRAELQKPLTK